MQGRVFSVALHDGAVMEVKMPMQPRPEPALGIPGRIDSALTAGIRIPNGPHRL